MPSLSLRSVLAAVLPWLMLASLAGCTCGFDCSDNDDEASQGPARLTLGFSDALPEDLEQVVLQVTRIELQRSNGQIDEIDTFTIDELDAVDAESFQVDLLEYGGRSQLAVLTDFELASGRITDIRIEVADSGVNTSFVEEADGTVLPLRVAGSTLELDGRTLVSGEQAWTVEFELGRSLRFRESSEDYLLTTTGMRVVDADDSASITGSVDEDLFDRVSPCDGKTDPDAGNRVYLYEGVDLDPEDLADVFTGGSTEEIPPGAIAPFSVDQVQRNPNTGVGEYAFGFLPAGDYTLVFSCAASGDDPVDFDDLPIPLPDNQLYEFSLSAGERAVCNLQPDPDC